MSLVSPSIPEDGTSAAGRLRRSRPLVVAAGGDSGCVFEAVDMSATTHEIASKMDLYGYRSGS